MIETGESRFERLYDRHHQLVRRILYNMVETSALEDLVQEAFLKIWKGLPRFAFRSQEKTWIYRITVNAAIDHLRNREPEHLPLTADESRATSALGEDRTEQQAELQQALMTLDENQRSLIVLYYFEEQGVAELSRIFGIPAGTVKSRLFEARQVLKNRLARSADVLSLRADAPGLSPDEATAGKQKKSSTSKGALDEAKLKQA